MKVCIPTGHLYGRGGGADVVYWISKALKELGHDVVIFSKSTIPRHVVMEYLPDGVAVSSYYQNCSLGFDMLVNIDHNDFEPPVAGTNWAFIFHPHGGLVPPEGYNLILSNSDYTGESIKQAWGVEATTLYTSIRERFLVESLRVTKKPVILHCSRISRPYETADKAQPEMLSAFKAMCNNGLKGWEFWIVGSGEDAEWLDLLMANAKGYPVRFWIDQSEDVVVRLFSEAAIYWHMTGVNTPSNRATQEHLGLTTIQAMVAGTVPVIRPTGGQPEIVTDAVDGLYAPSLDVLMNLTGALIGNLSAWGALSIEARRGAMPWCDSGAFVERVESLLEGQKPHPHGKVVPKILDEPYTVSDVTIVIPTLDSRCKAVERLVSHLMQTGAGVKTVVVVSDCGDTIDADDDGWLINETGNVKWCYQKDRLTFSEANNAALEHVDTELVLLMNDDVTPAEDNWLEFAVSSWNESADYCAISVGAMGFKLVTRHGRLQHAGLVWDLNREDIGFHRWYLQEDRPAANQLQTIPAVTGACVLVKKEFLPLESGYEGMNYEDLDLCLRIWEAGQAVVYDPRVWLFHDEGITKASVTKEIMDEAWATNRLWFTDKWAAQLMAPDSEGLERAVKINKKAVEGLGEAESEVWRSEEDES